MVEITRQIITFALRRRKQGDFVRPIDAPAVFTCGGRWTTMAPSPMTRPSGPVTSGAAWRGAELGAEPAAWRLVLGEDEREALARALARIREHPVEHILAEAPAAASLTAHLADVRRRLRDGVGFVLVRGFPVDLARTRDEAAALFRLLGAALGDAVPQNGAGELVCDIRDTGADPDDPNTRLYTTRAEQDFHTDGADIIGLLSLKTAKRGGVSRIVSSVSVVNRISEQRPDLAPLLFEPWCFHLHGELPAGAPRHFEMPICRWDGRHLSTFFIGWYIRRAQGLPEVPRLSSAQREVLELFERTANDPSLTLDMSFEPGDIQWLKNAVILHKRTAYEDDADPSERRHLLRLWLTARDFEDGDERLRRGVATEAVR